MGAACAGTRRLNQRPAWLACHPACRARGSAHTAQPATCTLCRPTGALDARRRAAEGKAGLRGSPGAQPLRPSPLVGCTSCTGSAPGSDCTSRARCTTSALPCLGGRGGEGRTRARRGTGTPRRCSGHVRRCSRHAQRDAGRKCGAGCARPPRPHAAQLALHVGSLALAHLAERHNGHLLRRVDHRQGEGDALRRGLGRVAHRQHPALCGAAAARQLGSKRRRQAAKWGSPERRHRRGKQAGTHRCAPSPQSRFQHPGSGTPLPAAMSPAP